MSAFALANGHSIRIRKAAFPRPRRHIGQWTGDEQREGRTGKIRIRIYLRHPLRTRFICEERAASACRAEDATHSDVYVCFA